MQQCAARRCAPPTPPDGRSNRSRNVILSQSIKGVTNQLYLYTPANICSGSAPAAAPRLVWLESGASGCVQNRVGEAWRLQRSQGFHSNSNNSPAKEAFPRNLAMQLDPGDFKSGKLAHPSRKAPT